ncbi:MAG: hypothetical protein CME32_20845 [Gimesia sp.]|nr:hypothetical protein [Gimesia sp.]
MEMRSGILLWLFYLWCSAKEQLSSSDVRKQPEFNQNTGSRLENRFLRRGVGAVLTGFLFMQDYGIILFSLLVF